MKRSDILERLRTGRCLIAKQTSSRELGYAVPCPYAEEPFQNAVLVAYRRYEPGYTPHIDYAGLIHDDDRLLSMLRRIAPLGDWREANSAETLLLRGALAGYR